MVSVKHHYLPRKYLKGFSDNNEGYFVYDKQEDRIFPSGPIATFYENHLNTITLPSGDTTDFLEELYTDMENQAWHSLDTIRASTSKTSIGIMDKMHLFLFLLFLHWRLPSNIGLLEKLSEAAFDENNDLLDFLVITNNKGEQAPEEIIKTIKESAAFKKSVKVFAPFAPFLKNKDWYKNLDNWRFLYSVDNKSWYIIGDNPLITEGKYDHDPVNCLREFIFPVSGRILLVNIEPPINKELPPELVLKYGVAILERAQRFVACQNEDFLKALIKIYKFYIQYDKTALIIPEFFRSLKA